MRILVRVVLLVCLFLSLGMTSVLATKWVELEPQEVFDRAEKEKICPLVLPQ